ncbi:SixA phosphatase family protein [Nonomuraea wenchangensis]
MAADLVRHAKAEWNDGDDHERPLADRGRKDAPIAGRWLAGTGITPDLALVTTAARGRETWELIASELPQRPRTMYDERLYEASVGELIAVINETSVDVDNLLVLGGNPGIHAVANTLAGDAEGDLQIRMNRYGFPTAAIAVLILHGSWKAAEHGMATLGAFWAPHA